jgi:uroporphyrinogen-III decarboxylase
MNVLKIKNEIKELFHRKSELIDSRENKRRMDMWGPDICPDEYSPVFLKPVPQSGREDKRVPITADWDRMQKSRLLKFDISEYYREPLAYLKGTLEIDIHRFNNFHDDTPLTKTIPIFLGSAFETSLFGVPVIYSTEREPIFSSEGAVLKKRNDLSSLKSINFKESGIMPLAHRFYSEISEMAPEYYSVIFPKWSRSPFGVACGLRGMENLLIDMIEDHEFVHNLMRFITDQRKKYSTDRRSFLKKIEIESTIYNDEASVPIISPGMYEEFCLPYESELSEFYNGIRFWHSCGSKTALIPLLKKFSKPIGFMDLNWETDDLYKAVKELKGCIPFHVRSSRREVMEKNETILINHLSSIFSICRNENYMLRVTGFQPDYPKVEDIDRVNKYIHTAKKVYEGFLEDKK